MNLSDMMQSKMDFVETSAGNLGLHAAGDLGHRRECILWRNVVLLCYTLCPPPKGSKGIFC